jgi:hypothetical protein
MLRDFQQNVAKRRESFKHCWIIKEEICDAVSHRFKKPCLRRSSAGTINLFIAAAQRCLGSKTEFRIDDR